MRQNNICSSHESDAAIKLYLREISEVKLLTPQVEIALATRVKKGDQQARKRMITANLDLVVKIAQDHEGLGLPLLDLISEGNIGLIKGVERFNPAKAGKLATYASGWIKRCITRVLANQSRTPPHSRLACRSIGEIEWTFALVTPSSPKLASGVADAMGLQLVRMDPDDHCRCRYPDDYYRRRFGMIFCVPSIFPMVVIFSAAMARKNAASSREHGGNAD